MSNLDLSIEEETTGGDCGIRAASNTSPRGEEDMRGDGRDTEHPVVLPILAEGYGSFFGGTLPLHHPFHWGRIIAAPKADHGTYSMRWMRTMTYHVLHNNGFLRLATERGRVYWLAQNETMHTTPDWKIHFSIAPRGDWEEDIGVAWNILSSLFMERCCEVGMKAKYSPWLDTKQQGRELTVYIYAFDAQFNEGHVGGPMAGLSPEGLDHLHHLGREFEAWYGGNFWMLFILEAERLLRAAGLHSAGVADGDLALPGCNFASIRNEAYVRELNEDWINGDPPSQRQVLQYPPNRRGWNAAGHQNPFEATVELLRRQQRLVRITHV